jgi:hypothetical protein
VHLDTDKTMPPVQVPLRRLLISVREEVAAELQRLESNGFIAPVAEPTPWVSALLGVAKPDGCIRLCNDPKPVNVAL